MCTNQISSFCSVNLRVLYILFAFFKWALICNSFPSFWLSYPFMGLAIIDVATLWAIKTDNSFLIMIGSIGTVSLLGGISIWHTNSQLLIYTLILPFFQQVSLNRSSNTNQYSLTLTFLIALAYLIMTRTETVTVIFSILLCAFYCLVIFALGYDLESLQMAIKQLKAETRTLREQSTNVALSHHHEKVEVEHKADGYLSVLANLKFSSNENENIRQFLDIIYKTAGAVAVSFFSVNIADNKLVLVDSLGESELVIPCREINSDDSFSVIASRFYDRRPIVHTDFVASHPRAARSSNVDTVFLYPVASSTIYHGVLVIGFEPLDAKILKERLHFCHIIGNRITTEMENLLLQKQTERMANTDGMTGLYNRSYFERKFPLLLEHCSSVGNELGVIMFDMDYFKQLNDSGGHDYGDTAIKALSHILMNNIRRNDMAFRIGGDEFCLILPAADEKVCTRIATTISTQYKDKQFKGILNDKEVVSSLSVGIAVYPQHGNSPKVILQAADDALYSVKKSSKDDIKVAPIIGRIPMEQA